jgi:hypothetical protein
MAAAAVDPIQDILDWYTDMSDFLEIDAQVNDPEQRARIIQGGFWDLTDLQNKTPEFAKKVCKVIRHQRGNQAASAVSVFTEMTLIRLILYCVYTYMVQRPLDYNDIDQDRLERIQDWFETKKETNDNSAVVKFTDGCNKRD